MIHNEKLNLWRKMKKNITIDHEITQFRTFGFTIRTMNKKWKKDKIELLA